MTLERITQSRRRRIFATVSAGVFMSTMDSSMVNVALPVIMQSYQSPLALTEWVVLTYLLTITVLLLFWGHLSDRWARGTIYSFGMLIFTAGSLFCAAAPTISLLILCRFIQGFGASMMMAVGPALIRSAFPPDQLGQGLGLLGVATSFGLMTGPVISGLLIHWSHWRFIFLITVPIGLVFFLLGRKSLSYLSLSQRYQQDGMHEPPAVPQPFDRIGALLWTISVTITLLLATHATSLGHGKNIVGSPLFFIGLVLIPLFWSLLLNHEKKCVSPLLPLDLFRQRFFLMAFVSANLSFAVLFSVLIIIPFFLARILNLSADRIGTVMMAVPLLVFIVSPVAGKIHDRMGARIVATIGLLCCLASLLLLTGLNENVSPLNVAARLALLGFGQALFLSPNSAAALAGVSHRQTGVTSSLLATARNMGMLLGTALTGLVFTMHFANMTGGLDLKDFTQELAPAFLSAMKRSFQYSAIVALLGVLASWFRGGENDGKKDVREQVTLDKANEE